MSNIALEKELAEIDMTQFQNVDNRISNLSRSSLQPQTPKNCQVNGGQVSNQYLTPTPNRSQPTPTTSIAYPPCNANGGNLCNNPTNLPMAPPPNHRSTNSMTPTSSTTANDGLLPGLTLASVKNHKTGFLRNVKLAEYQTKCRLCNGTVLAWEHYIEQLAVLNAIGKVLYVKWDHVCGNCKKPSRKPTDAELNTPVNGRSVIDIATHQWIVIAGDVPSHHNSAPLQATRTDSFFPSQRSINSAPPIMPSDIILHNMNNGNSEATTTLQPRYSGYTADLNQGGSLCSTHSELTPVTFAHAASSHQPNNADLHTTPGEDANHVSSVQPSNGNFNEERANSILVDTQTQPARTANTYDTQQLEQDLIANAAVDQALFLRGLPTIQSPMIGDNTELIRQGTNLVLDSVVHEAVRATNGVAYPSPEHRVAAGVRYIESAGITDANFISLATERLQGEFRDNDSLLDDEVSNHLSKNLFLQHFISRTLTVSRQQPTPSV